MDYEEFKTRCKKNKIISDLRNDNSQIIQKFNKKDEELKKIIEENNKENEKKLKNKLEENNKENEKKLKNKLDVKSLLSEIMKTKLGEDIKEARGFSRNTTIISLIFGGLAAGTFLIEFINAVNNPDTTFENCIEKYNSTFFTC